MINKYTTTPFKKWIKKKLRNTIVDVSSEVYESEREENQKEIERIKDAVKNITYFQYQNGEDYFVIPRAKEEYEICELGLPIPPKDLWLGYGDSKEVYLYGKVQSAKMIEVVSKTGLEIKAGGRILDFGCGAGRMIRWLKPLAETCEIWGIDISSDHIFWAKKYLSPPFNFATTTTIPHLPFEDKYFDLIYAGSVFTHIDDLTEAWLLELRRILKPDGRIFITIQDKHSVEMLKNHPLHKKQWLAELIKEKPLSEGLMTDYAMITGRGRGAASQVFYDIEYFCNSIKKILQTVTVIEEMYGFQTGIILKKNEQRN